MPGRNREQGNVKHPDLRDSLKPRKRKKISGGRME
jgi:hypothetical protein